MLQLKLNYIKIILIFLLINTALNAEDNQKVSKKPKNILYVTEKNVQIDRCASAWFIRRFIDSKAKFAFINLKKDGKAPQNAITYDFFGAQYFHKGPGCTFTSFVKKYVQKPDQSLVKMEALVNDVFAWRNIGIPFSKNIKEYIHALSQEKYSDLDIYHCTMPIFDLIYAHYLGKNEKPIIPNKNILVYYNAQIIISEIIEILRLKQRPVPHITLTDTVLIKGKGISKEILNLLLKQLSTTETKSLEYLKKILTEFTEKK